MATRIARMGADLRGFFFRRDVNCNADYAERADLRGFLPVVMSIATRTTRIFADHLKTRFAHF